MIKDMDNTDIWDGLPEDWGWSDCWDPQPEDFHQEYIKHDGTETIQVPGCICSPF